MPCKEADHRVVLKFLKENIFSRFGVPKAIISDGGSHFCNKPFKNLLAKYGVKHKVATPYCNTPKYTLVVFDMFRVFCKPNLTVS